MQVGHLRDLEDEDEEEEVDEVEDTDELEVLLARTALGDIPAECPATLLEARLSLSSVSLRTLRSVSLRILSSVSLLILSSTWRRMRFSAFCRVSPGYVCVLCARACVCRLCYVLPVVCFFELCVLCNLYVLCVLCMYALCACALCVRTLCVGLCFV